VHGLVVFGDAGDLAVPDSVKSSACAAPVATSTAATNPPGRRPFWRALGDAAGAAAAGARSGRRTIWWVGGSPWVLGGVFGGDAAAIVLAFNVLGGASSAPTAELPANAHKTKKLQMCALRGGRPCCCCC